MSEHPEHQSKQERMREALERIKRACDEELTQPYYVATNPPAVVGTFAAIENIARAALSDVTEQKQILSDKPEPLGQTREETDCPKFLKLHDDLALIGGRLMIWVEKNNGYESAAEINAVIDDATRLVTECEGDHSPSLGTVARLRKALDVLGGVPSVASTQPQDGRIQKTSRLGEDKKE